MDGLNELNNGPRAKSSKNQKGLAPVTAKGQNVQSNGSNDEEKIDLELDEEIPFSTSQDTTACILEGKYFFLKLYFSLILIYFISLDVFL